jgi:hypothetical protein
MPANVDGMVREGITAYRSGRKEEARTLLLRAVEIDQYNEQAWLWLSAVVETPEEQRTCLENVLTINPANDRARQGIALLDQKLSAGARSQLVQADDVLASASFAAPSPAAPKSAPAQDADELPTSIEWTAPPTSTSSASAAHPVQEPSAEEYDDWLSRLNIGVPGKPTAPAIPSDVIEAASKFAALPAEEDEDDQRFDPAATSDLDDLLTGPFSDTTASQVETRKEPTAPALTARTSPTPSTRLSAASPPAAELGAFSGDIRGTALIDDFDLDEAPADEIDLTEYFRYIPEGITPTRLPGTNERYPVAVIIGIVLAVLLNLGALALFIANMTAT